MPWPTSQDYFEAVQNPQLNFGEAELRQGKPRLSPMGLPIVMSGNFADVYPIECPGNRVYAVKCFTREVKGQGERYREISAYLQQVKLPFTVEFSYLDGEQGIRIRGQWYPVLKMEWVEGTTLNQFVGENVQKPQTLEALGKLWVQLAQKMRDAQMAHADLQHGNVLLVPVPGAKAGTVKLKLIDYDGMFVPALANRASGELGHVNYQHPARFRDQVYSAEVDRFPHLVICTALRCLAVAGSELWEHHDNGDNLLFRQGDFQHPGSSPLFHELWKLSDPTARALVGQLVLAARGPLGQEPHLSDLLSNGEPPVLSVGQKQQIDLLFSLGVPKRVAPAPQIAGQVLPADGIVVACVCGRRFMAPAHLAGRSVPCPTCGNAIHVPHPASPQPPSYDWYSQPVPQPHPAPRVSRAQNVLQRLDQFLLRLVGTNNTLLHQFLRIALPLVSLTAIIITATLIARSVGNGSSSSQASAEPRTIKLGGGYEVVERTIEPPPSKSPVDPFDPPVEPQKNDKKPKPAIFASIKPQFIDEESLFQLFLSAQQKPMFFKLVSSLEGAKINSATGLFTWTPTESQGPGSYLITAVAQSNEFASESLDRVTFKIEVGEVNKQPVLEKLSEKLGESGKPLTFSLTATDPDLPPNKLRFEMSGQPAGATLGYETGTFAWTPADHQAGQNYRITFFVTDDGSPPRKDQQSIFINVPAMKPRAANVARKAGDIAGKFRQDGFSNTFQIRFRGNDIEVYGATVPSTNPEGIFKRTAANTYMYFNKNRRLTIKAVSADEITLGDASGNWTFRRIPD